jgi:hypothetical protein
MKQLQHDRGGVKHSLPEINGIQLVLFGMPNRTFGPCLAAMHRIRTKALVIQAPFHQRRLPAASLKPMGYSWSYLACRPRHLVDVWEPYTWGPHSSDASSDLFDEKRATWQVSRSSATKGLACSLR